MKELHVYHIGEEGEIFAGRTEQEVKNYYAELMGQEEAEEAFQSEFSEIEDIDTPIEMNFEGEIRFISWRQLAEKIGVPNQLSTTYV